MVNSVDSGNHTDIAPQEYAGVISADGRFVSFLFDGSLDPRDVQSSSYLTNQYDIYVRDLTLPTFDLVSVTTSNTSTNDSGSELAMSGDGRFVVFESGRNDLDPNNSKPPSSAALFVRDRFLASTTMLSAHPESSGSGSPWISENGLLAAYSHVHSSFLNAGNRVHAFAMPTIQVDAGPDQTISVLVTGNLSGQAPSGYSVLWSTDSGPAACTFGNAASAQTTVVAGVAGTYVLRLTATSGSQSVSDTLVITVTNQAPALPTGNG
jgi:hypothetical protein